ncbi:hypothetical protein CJ030_MR6G021503 [Morella rubra]|uniref:Transmembrane protein 214-A n=1 Tax=Morella rubra TaxID=262757 RepID=A0A6A1VHH0_9ROSI|nr:hypothetical protein CJ030_MR6G021503 [Morella rubra]
MDENSAIIEAILREQEEEEQAERNKNKSKDSQKGNEFSWQTVSYPKRNRKASKPPQADNSADLPSYRPNGTAASADVFRSIEQHSEERRRRALDAQLAAKDAAGERSKRHSDDDEDSDAEVSVAAAENGEVKPKKQKKPKKPKVTVSEAASKIDVGDLSAFLIDITSSYESQQDIQLMRFADYFGRAFASVSAAQFPWLKTFKEFSVAKLFDIPLSSISEDVYKTSVDWIGKRSSEALGSFVLWSLDSIFADFASHQAASKGSKKAVQPASSKSQVAIFVVLAMALRRKPDVLISLLPIVKESPKYQGQDKLPVTIWVIAQASQGDLAVGLYMWIYLLLPLLGSKSGCNPLSRDLILQLVERILSSPKARTILLNGAVRKGERVVPPSALDLLMRVTYPAQSGRLKATERFEAVYPTLKEVALAGSPGSKAMRQVAQEILNIAIKAAREGIPDLSREASGIFIWCLGQNPECYRQWDMLYLDNLEASVVILRKLSEEWKEHSAKHPTLNTLRETLQSFKLKNEKASAKGDEGAHNELLKDADKYCKVILRQLSQGHGCLKSMVFVSVALAVVAGIMSQNMQFWDYRKLSEMLNLQ